MAYRKIEVDGVELRFINSTRKVLTIDSKERLCKHVCSLPEWCGNVHTKSDRILFLMQVAKAMGYKTHLTTAKTLMRNLILPYERGELTFDRKDAIAVARKPLESLTVSTIAQNELEKACKKLVELKALMEVEEERIEKLRRYIQIKEEYLSLKEELIN